MNYLTPDNLSNQSEIDDSFAINFSSLTFEQKITHSTPSDIEEENFSDDLESNHRSSFFSSIDSFKKHKPMDETTVKNFDDDFNLHMTKLGKRGSEIFIEDDENFCSEFDIMDIEDNLFNDVPPPANLINFEIDKLSNHTENNQPKPVTIALMIEQEAINFTFPTEINQPNDLIAEEIEENAPNDKELSEQIFNEFCNVFKIFILNTEFNQDDFEKLNKSTKNLLLEYLNRIFKTKFVISEFNYSQFQNFKNMTTNKRNEEKIKNVYKTTFKHLKAKFKNKYQNFKQNNLEMPDIAGSMIKSFYYNFFKSLVKEKQITLDLLMDIIHEKVIKKKSKCEKLSMENNWRSQPLKAMKKIPASFRYMVCINSKIKEKFIGFITSTKQRSLRHIMSKNIEDKCEKKINHWETIFKDNGSCFEIFVDKITHELKNNKFKSPWTMIDVDSAIKHCVSELEITKLSREFNEVKRNHYSFAE